MIITKFIKQKKFHTVFVSSKASKDDNINMPRFRR